MRQDRSAKVTVYTKGMDISHAGCGLPHYVGGGRVDQMVDIAVTGIAPGAKIGDFDTRASIVFCDHMGHLALCQRIFKLPEAPFYGISA